MKKLLSFLLSLTLILSITAISGCNEPVEDNTPIYDTAYTYNDTHHWRNQLNGNGTTEYEEHEDDRGRCECGMYYDYSEYLTFELITDDDRKTYSTLGYGYKITEFIGDEFDSPLHIEIPATYQGEEDEEPLPVLAIMKNVFSPSRKEGLVSLESVKFNEGLTHILHSAFSGCSFPKAVLPDSMQYLDLSAFSGNIELKEFYTGDGLEGFRDYTFSGCSKLEKVVLGENFKELRQRDFYSCASLKSIVLPESFVSIPEDSIAAHGVEHALINALGGLSDIYLDFSEEELKERTIPQAKRDLKTGNRWHEYIDKDGNLVSGYYNIYTFKYVLWADTTYGLVEGWNGEAKLHFKGTWHYDENGNPVAN